MKKLIEPGRYVVYDDFLGADEHTSLWNYFQSVDFEFLQTTSWFKVFRLEDGNPLRGPAAMYGRSTDGAYSLTAKIAAIRKELTRYLGLEQPLDGFSYRASLYRAGDALSWHSDRGSLAQWIYYCHPRWQAAWGGELMVSEADGVRSRDLPTASGSVRVGHQLDSHLEDDALLDTGRGAYLMAKPDRLVVVPGGVQHRIARVDHSAGNNVRASFTGFFFETPK